MSCCVKGGKRCSSACGELIAMRLLDFGDQTVSTQHAQLPTDFGRLSAPIIGRVVGGVKQQWTQVSIPESVYDELGSIDSCQQLSVSGGPGLQSPHSFAVPLGRLTDHIRELTERLFAMDFGERIQIAVVSR